MCCCSLQRSRWNPSPLQPYQAAPAEQQQQSTLHSTPRAVTSTKSSPAIYPTAAVWPEATAPTAMAATSRADPGSSQINAPAVTAGHSLRTILGESPPQLATTLNRAAQQLQLVTTAGGLGALARTLPLHQQLQQQVRLGSVGQQQQSSNATAPAPAAATAVGRALSTVDATSSRQNCQAAIDADGSTASTRMIHCCPQNDGQQLNRDASVTQDSQAPVDTLMVVPQQSPARLVFGDVFDLPVISLPR